MTKWWWRGAAVGIAAICVTLAMSCSSDDSGNNTNELTDEEQFAAVSEFFDFDPDGNDPGEFNVVGLVLGLISAEYWDGVDPNDFGAGGRSMANHMLAPLGKQFDEDDDSLFYDYIEATGWWVIYIRGTASEENLSVHLVIRDSVRFEDQEGNAQEQPNLSTFRLRYRQQLNAEVMGVIEGHGGYDNGTLELTGVAGSRVDIEGLNTPFAIINGTAGIDLDLLADHADTSADLSIQLSGAFDDLTAPIVEEGQDVCPTDGSVTAGLVVDIELQKGQETASAHGSWDASIDFTGGGNATVIVEAGDMTRQFTGDVCPGVR